MIDMKARNREIKTLLERDYGKGQVSVTGNRGTAYGWVDVYIKRPAPCENGRAETIRQILAAGIELGRYEGAFGQHYEIHVRFAE
jgi:hypothetical protein